MHAVLHGIHQERSRHLQRLLSCAVCSEGALALLVDLEALAELTSLGTLVTFFCTAAALLWRRYCDGSPGSKRDTALRLSCIIASSLGESASRASAVGRLSNRNTMQGLFCILATLIGEPVSSFLCGNRAGMLSQCTLTLKFRALATTAFRKGAGTICPDNVADLRVCLCLQCSALLRCLARQHGPC